MGGVRKGGREGMGVVREGGYGSSEGGRVWEE